FPFASAWFTVSLVPVESALDYDPQMGLIGLQQFHNPWQIVAQFLLNHYLKFLVDHTQVTISCTQIDSAVELHQRWPPFLVERLVKQNAVYPRSLSAASIDYQIVGRERRERFSQLAWRGDGCFDSRRRVNSTVGCLRCLLTRKL